MTQTRKIQIDSEKYNEVREVTISGVKVTGALSPYDIPELAVATYDPEKTELRIHLRYLTSEEPTAIQSASDTIDFALGKQSGKLYEVILKGYNPSENMTIRIDLLAEVAQLAENTENETPPNFMKKLNLLTAKKVLEEEQDLYAVG